MCRAANRRRCENPPGLGFGVELAGADQGGRLCIAQQCFDRRDRGRRQSRAPCADNAGPQAALAYRARAAREAAITGSLIAQCQADGDLGNFGAARGVLCGLQPASALYISCWAGAGHQRKSLGAVRQSCELLRALWLACGWASSFYTMPMDVARICGYFPSQLFSTQVWKCRWETSGRMPASVHGVLQSAPARAALEICRGPHFRAYIRPRSASGGVILSKRRTNPVYVRCILSTAKDSNESKYSRSPKLFDQDRFFHGLCPDLSFLPPANSREKLRDLEKTN